MEPTHTRNKEKKSSQLSQATPFLGGGSKASLSHSEESLTRISTELTDEALFIAGYYMNPVPTKEKQTQDRGTQMSKHVIFTKTRGTDTCSDTNHACTKAFLLPSPLPSPHDKVPQAMGTVVSLTDAAPSSVRDRDQRQIQLTTSHCSCPEETDFLVPLGHLIFPSSALVLEAARSSKKALGLSS